MTSENGEQVQLDGTSRSESSAESQRINELLSRYPISLEFKLSSQPEAQSQCVSVPLEGAKNRCLMSGLNASSLVCRCDQFGFVSTNSNSWPQSTQLQLPFEFGQSSTRDLQPIDLLGPNLRPPTPASSGLSTSSLLLICSALVLVALVTFFLLRAFVRLSGQSRLAKKEATFLGSGPTTDPQLDRSLMTSAACCVGGAAPSTSIINLNQAACQMGQQRPTATPMYAAHLPPLKTPDYVAANRQFPAYRTPNRWLHWLRPSNWLAALGGGRGKQLHHVQHHRVVGSSGPYSAKSHYQNGYTTSLHQSAAHLAPLTGPTSSNSTSSYVSSSAYYEEIGPSNLTRLSTSQLVPSHHSTTIVDPFKRAHEHQISAHHHSAFESQQTINPSYGQSMALLAPKQHFNQLDLTTHAQQQLRQNQQQHFQSSSSSAGSQHSSSTVAPQSPANSSATNSTTTPRHYLFASPSAVSAYKSSMSQHTLQQHQYQQRFMQNN